RVANEVYETPIENLDLTVRVFNSLKRTGITNVGEVLDMLEKGEEAMLSIRNFGEKSLEELKERLMEKGYLDEDSDEEAEAE
ncbi:MAG: DNA-directed RNA polymerase subunit alpha C-terminal domain-containing protein, partial [Anaerolineales bacterium]